MSRRIEDTDRVAELAQRFAYDESLLYDALVGSTDEYVYVCNLHTNTIRYPARMIAEFDLPGEVIHDPVPKWKHIIHPQDWQRFYEANTEPFDYSRVNYHIVEYRAQNRRGQWVWLQCRGIRLCDASGEPALFAGYISDMGRRNKVDQQTGLYNQVEFERQTRALAADPAGTPFGLLVLGMDNFRQVNERYDRQFGDEVLRAVTQKLLSILPGNAGLYRLSGDQYGLLTHHSGAGEITALYEKIQRQLDHQQELSGKKYYCTVSAGCALCPQDAMGYEELYRRAECAYDYAKKHGKNRLCFFSQEVLDDSEKSTELILRLQESVEHGCSGFTVLYQPQVLAKTGELRGVEALLRWDCPAFPGIGPSEFVPVLESCGLIRRVGKWVLHEAIVQARRLLQVFPRLSMSVNVSYKQLIDPDGGVEESLLDYVRRELEAFPLGEGRLILELTESCIIDRVDETARLMERFHELGVGVAVDDFGTGYTALGILKRMPVDLVKVDRSFVQSENRSEFDEVFLKFVSRLCHQVGAEVCQEGVEDEAQYRRVLSAQADYIQGFWFGRPMTVGKLIETFGKSE